MKRKQLFCVAILLTSTYAHALEGKNTTVGYAPARDLRKQFKLSSSVRKALPKIRIQALQLFKRHSDEKHTPAQNTSFGLALSTKGKTPKVTATYENHTFTFRADGSVRIHTNPNQALRVAHYLSSAGKQNAMQIDNLESGLSRRITRHSDRQKIKLLHHTGNHINHYVSAKGELLRTRIFDPLTGKRRELAPEELYSVSSNKKDDFRFSAQELFDKHTETSIGRPRKLQRIKEAPAESDQLLKLDPSGLSEALLAAYRERRDDIVLRLAAEHHRLLEPEGSAHIVAFSALRLGAHSWVIKHADHMAKRAELVAHIAKQRALAQSEVVTTLDPATNRFDGESLQTSTLPQPFRTAFGRAYALSGRNKEAIAYAQSVLAEDERNADALHTLAIAHRNRGSFAEAINFIKQIDKQSVEAAAISTKRQVDQLAKKLEHEVSRSKELKRTPVLDNKPFSRLGGMDPSITRIKQLLALWNRSPSTYGHLAQQPRGMLITGSPGLGKTVLARQILKYARTKRFIRSGGFVDGETIASPDQLANAFQKAGEDDTNILVIDNLDSLVAPAPGQPRANPMAPLLAHLMRTYPHVFVVGIAGSKKEIPPNLTDPAHLSHEIALEVPSAVQRREILRVHTAGKALADDVKLSKFAKSTRGYTGADLATLANMAGQNAINRAIEAHQEQHIPVPEGRKLAFVQIESRDFESALQVVEPSALSGFATDVPTVTYDDIGGYEKEKKLLDTHVVLPLQNPNALQRLGAKLPKGAVLHGPPGTGKTLLLQATANKAGVPLVIIKGSDIKSKWFSESERNIADLFAKVRNLKRGILLLDELDALAPKRLEGSSGGDRASNAIVNQLLQEIQGITGQEGSNIVVVGATNRLEAIDDALLRSGRLGEHIYVGKPKRASVRRKIFEVQPQRDVWARDVNLDRLAKITKGFTGADISQVTTKAAILALSEDKGSEAVSMRHLVAAIRSMKRARARSRTEPEEEAHQGRPMGFHTFATASNNQ